AKPLLRALVIRPMQPLAGTGTSSAQALGQSGGQADLARLSTSAGMLSFTLRCGWETAAAIYGQIGHAFHFGIPHCPVWTSRAFSFISGARGWRSSSVG